MSTLKIEHIANIANSGPDISIDTNGHLNIVNGSLQMGGTTMLDTSDTSLKNISKIGIGTSNPSTLLHIDGGGSQPELRVAMNSTYYTDIGINHIDVNGPNDLRFLMGGAEKVRIDSSGRVGINETNPSSVGAKLTVRGDVGANAVFVGGNSTSGNSWGMGINAGSTSADASFRIYDKDGSASYLYVRGDGNVGIGTTTPDKTLTVRGTSGDIVQAKIIYAGSDGNRSGLILQNTHTGGREYGLYVGNNSTGGGLGNSFGISDNTAGTAYRLLIDSDGDIGMGVAPYANARLTIGGTEGGGYPAVLQFDNNNSSGAEFFMLATDTNWSAGANKFIMGHGAPSSNNTDVCIDNNGYVGINTTSPQRALHIHDHSSTGLHITNTQSGAGANDGFSQYIRDDNQATELMVRENSYLGFGTNNTLRAKILSSGEFFWPEIGNRGDLSFPICSISNNGSGGQYLHAQFQSYGGVMFHIHFRGYEYIGGSMREGSGGGYIYNTGGQNTAYARGYSGHCVEVYQTTTNRIELVINTGTSQAGNRWGSYVFFGGTDTITGDTPLTLVQYGWNNSTGRLYSS